MRHVYPSSSAFLFLQRVALTVQFSGTYSSIVAEPQIARNTHELILHTALQEVADEKLQPFKAAACLFVRVCLIVWVLRPILSNNNY